MERDSCSTQMDAEMKIRLSSDAMRQFGVAKIFQESDEQKKSLCFSRDGQRLVACDHQNLVVYSCMDMKQLCQVHMQQFHPEAVCFTPQNEKLLHTATRMDHAIRCLDLSSHQHTRLFSGHSGKIRHLRFQPGSEHNFSSVGRDNKLLMWDLRCSSYTKRLDRLKSPLLGYDPAGLVFATSSSTECIEIYDVRMISEKPCQKFNYSTNRLTKWTQLQFAPDGKTILLSTDYSRCFAVDAFNGAFCHAYTGYSNDEHLPLQATYTSDSQFVLAGADAGRVHVWNAATGQLVAVLLSNSFHPVRCIEFNPKIAMFVSSDVMTLFWLPKADGNYDYVNEIETTKQVEKPAEVASSGIPTIDLTVNDDSDQEAIQPQNGLLMRRIGLRRRLALKRRVARPEKKCLEEGELSDDD